MMDIAPCEGHASLFDSVHWGDHQRARRFCDGCEFYTACLRMTDAEQAGELGAHCVEGTRAGSLYVGGKRVTKPRATGRNGGPPLAMPETDADVLEARAAYKRGDRTPWAGAGNRAYERQRYAKKRSDA